MTNCRKSHHKIESKNEVSANLFSSLNNIFQQFRLESDSEEAFKLKQIIDGVCNVLRNTVNIYVTDSNKQILYANNHQTMNSRLRDSEFIENQFIRLERIFSCRTFKKTDSVLCEEITVPLKVGHTIYLRCYLLPIYGDGEQVTHFIILFEDITKAKVTETKLNSMYFSDPLTQLPNRHSFEEDLFQQLYRIKDNQKLCSLFFLDLDRFKFFNDTLGHSVGDDLIVEIANALRTLESTSVSLYRFGGDEFTLMITNFKDETEIHQLAEQILALFKTPFHIQGIDLMITCSIGVSIYPQSATNFKKLIEAADTAMHYAKELGKDTYQVFAEHMNTAYSEKLKIESQLRKAVENNEFHLNYQPQIELKTNEILGVEALIRWINPELGFVPPNEFIPLAEETGLIDSIGDWVLKAACLQAKKWQIEKCLFIRVSINISPKQFQRPDFVTKVERVLEETGLEAKYVDLEITENGLMQNSYNCLKTLERLKNLGLKISIDDFGTGYSSLSYLKRFPIDTLKIDQSFIHDLINDSNDQAIVTSIINLAHNMKLNVIAEGVETVEVVRYLKEHQCDEMQGYLYSKPLPPVEFEAFLMKLKQDKIIF